jgi:hypothetical protein
MRTLSLIRLLVLCGAFLIMAASGIVRADLPRLTNATLFRTDAKGANQNFDTRIYVGTVSHGAYTTVLHQQNIPGNYAAELFLTTRPSPAPADFLSPAANLSLPLSPGANTFYFFGNGDDTQGGSAGFGLNLYFNLAPANSPFISAFAPEGRGQPVTADSSPDTAGYNLKIVPGAGSLTFSSGGYRVTLTDFQVTAAAARSTVDLVNSTNTSPFTPPPHADGVKDTYGHFTLTVTPETPVEAVPRQPPPAKSFGLAWFAVGLAGCMFVVALGVLAVVLIVVLRKPAKAHP